VVKLVLAILIIGGLLATLFWLASREPAQDRQWP
jgi:hypothetical protein